MHEPDSLKSQPVKYRFRNIGPVKDATLELGDLTVIAGRNNTGKTYIVYSLYGFLKMWERFLEPRIGGLGAGRVMKRQHQALFPDFQNVAETVVREGRAEFPLDSETLHQQRRKVFQEMASAFSKRGLPRVFSSRGDDFEGSFVEVELEEAARNDSSSVRIPFSDRSALSIEYDGSNVVIAVEDVSDQRIPRLRYVMDRYYYWFLLERYFPEPFILSAERFGISLFYKELDFAKNNLVAMLQGWPDDKRRGRISPFPFIDNTTSQYTFPIKDNIDYTRSIAELQRAKSEIYENKLFDSIKNMMEGYYSSSGDEIQFISKARGGKRRFKIPLHLASSSVRGLSDLYFFLRHVAKRNHLLIIDEPESHLDTANQILLARLLAKFVNAGLKVLITTHSDYLIKEINNLIMLSQSFKDKDTVIRKLKYGADDFLKPDSIRAYVAEGNGLSRCEVDGFGVDMPVFDKTIDEINKAANELSSRLPQDSEA